MLPRRPVLSRSIQTFYATANSLHVPLSRGTAQQRSSRFHVLLVCGFDTTKLAPYGSYTCIRERLIVDFLSIPF